MGRLSIALCAMIVAALALAAPRWEFIFKKLDGTYAIYGSGLGEPVEPSASDKKIALVIKGFAARDIFDAIGPDVPDVCLEKPNRVRKRDIDSFIACASKASTSASLVSISSRERASAAASVERGS